MRDFSKQDASDLKFILRVSSHYSHTHTHTLSLSLSLSRSPFTAKQRRVIETPIVSRMLNVAALRIPRIDQREIFEVSAMATRFRCMFILKRKILLANMSRLSVGSNT